MSRCQALIAVVFCAALMAGCNTPKRTQTTVAPAQPAEDEQALVRNQATDPCAMRMQDIIGQLLAYYVDHGQMPPKLEDLKPLADPGMDTTYTCPVSREPYVYIPGGIAANGLRDRLVLYDASPVHHGLRWAITMRPPMAGQIQMFVIPLNQKLLTAYTAGQ